MKLCKITLIKRYTINENGSTVCENVTPLGYNKYKIILVSHDEYPLIEGDNIGHCIGLVADDFIFAAGMVEITKAEGDSFIDSRGDCETNEDRAIKYKNRKQALIDAGIV